MEGQDYSFINQYNAKLSPSTVHCKNSYLSNFYFRYLFQRAISVFDFTLPDNWDRDYTIYNLFARGFLGVINTDKFGVIPQWCDLYGFNVFYRPTNILVANPLLKGIEKPIIGKECELLRLTPDYRGIIDIVSLYADEMALATESLGITMVNVKASVVFPAENKQQAESYKKMYDQLNEGNPATFIDKTLFDENGNTVWKPFVSNAKNQYLGQELIETLRNIENRFDTWVGIPNIATEKKERLLTDEVNRNDAETYAISNVWMNYLQDSIKRINKMFNLNVSVQFKYNRQEV